jgi:hypothetical protein
MAKAMHREDEAEQQPLDEVIERVDYWWAWWCKWGGCRLEISISSIFQNRLVRLQQDADGSTEKT